MLRIHYDDLEYDYENALEAFEGKPFTGVAFDEGPAGGRHEVEFVDGLKNGVAREWAPDGTLIRERLLRGDALDGMSREWFPSGVLRKEGLYESGLCLREKEWDEEGRLVRDYALSADDRAHKTLELIRARRKQADESEP